MDNLYELMVMGARAMLFTAAAGLLFSITFDICNLYDANMFPGKFIISTKSENDTESRFYFI